MTFTTAQLEVFFAFLDGLRESGATNMLGSGPYLERRFELTKHDAKVVVLAWIRTFGDGTDTPGDRARYAGEIGA